ncbi:hypothetical protein NDN01_10015 [Sphingomonas sp. QA11]|uniref:hypothetical protein n=1 Tax=Sphingomonas sp. QA11 TaxID=2950605 RepID=UPI00234A5D9C|nr:hypothetical protein [Sphingomonas sp. QA11]WCM29189.1 hypothetical protein NDN01_10015 [Sphingomonas sp. QA11]
MLLSTALPACVRTIEVPVDKPVPVAVAIKDSPPADLRKCAARPKGLPEEDKLTSQIPDAVRAGIIRIARAFAANAGQLDRLVNWSAPGTCPTPDLQPK